MNGTITLFLDIDGVLSIDDAGLPLAKVGNSHAYRWAHPIPQARALLQALDTDKDLGPVWCSHWGKDSPLWNYWSGTWRWLVSFPVENGSAIGGKPYAIQRYLDGIDKRGGVWVQDGFTNFERVWAERLGVRLVDATHEPIRSLLLSDEPGSVQVLIEIFAGNKVVL